MYNVKTTFIKVHQKEHRIFEKIRYLIRTQPIGRTISRTAHFLGKWRWESGFDHWKNEKQVYKEVMWVKQMIKQVMGTSKIQSNVD